MPDAFPEIETSRLVLREPASGRVRAVLELLPPEPRDDDVPTYPRPVLTLLTAAGDVALTVELDGVGHPRITVGPPDRGDAVIVTREGVSVWKNGSEAAVFDADGARQGQAR